MAYAPKPIQTTDITLSADLEELIERLAENAHDHWAQLRMSEGWTYGPNRDDSTKAHPCLVAYDQLPDSEKEYDRKTSRETLKAIIALGYRIDHDKPVVETI